MAITNVESIDFEDVSPKKTQMLRAIVVSCLGWALDLFDLFILLYVAPVIGALFFPSDYPTLSLAAVYGSFAVTLFMRPVGSAIFGHFADAHGRKGAMTVAMIGVGVSTAAFGTLPTIQQVGLIAPILFLILRLVQGVFVGGVVASTHTVGTESVPANFRGFMSGLVGGGGAAIGALFASIVYLATSWIFPGDAYAQWGWRFMFFSGLLSSVLGLYISLNLEESPFFKKLQHEKAAKVINTPAAPLKTLFSAAYRKVLLVNLLITFGSGAGYYLSSGYMPTFLKVINGVPNNVAALILMAASVAAFVSSVLIGTLSDRLGRKRTFMIVGVAAVVLLPLCYLGMAKTTDLTEIVLYALAIAFIGNAGYAPVLIFLNERFPTALRASGTGLSWNIGFALGGMTPTFASLASRTPADIPTSLAVFTVGAFIIYLIGSFIVPETKGRFT
ncbi:MFS transporter [Bradyrhizobium sp. 15]|uniref:MFS transporter n=1 Tax=Bradyrhizobium sp. 15 TaxID=2782633 RepID=UPI001FF92750|nr:MFS transporter [Bradyrhizobium sp. 15]MCK1440751.1 MFS transporter [Bradyrhizobium sp. 15]